ncbi:MAG: hypothetical protein HC846_13085 [Blastocatellia bacterium]|nr:hypothetical protein [Blastocatellia bacterium]
MFYYNQKHSYIFGLDPNYFYSKNPDLYKRLVDITAEKLTILRPKSAINSARNTFLPMLKKAPILLPKLSKAAGAKRFSRMMRLLF